MMTSPKDGSGVGDRANAGGGVVLLKHCQCKDCRQFFINRRGEPMCWAGIGGTWTTWGTGRRFCDPPPEVWHYCSGYDGPQISLDVWACPGPVRSETAPEPTPVQPAVPVQLGPKPIRKDLALW